MCVFGGGGGYVHVSAAALGDQKMAPDSLELELQAVVIHPAWALGV